LLFGGLVSTAFGTGYQSIAVAGWLQTLFILLFIELPAKRTWMHWVALWLTQALGFFIAMAVSSSRPHPSQAPLQGVVMFIRRHRVVHSS
jgi:hypothetical protein